jgi:hypothetical protein
VTKASVSLRKLTCAVVQSQCRSLFAARASDHGYLTIRLIAILDVSGDRQRSNGPFGPATTRPTVAVDRPLWRAKRDGRLWPNRDRRLRRSAFPGIAPQRIKCIATGRVLRRPRTIRYARLLDHLVGAQEECLWHCQTECSGGSQVNHQFELRRCALGGRS